MSYNEGDIICFSDAGRDLVGRIKLITADRMWYHVQVVDSELTYPMEIFRLLKTDIKGLAAEDEARDHIINEMRIRHES